MKTNKTFSFSERGKSFRYAGEGILAFFRNEHNARIHLLGTFTVIMLAIFLPVTPLETIALVVVMGLVWITELINTAIEKIMDTISRERHPAIKTIKDLSAATVLIAAVSALITGGIVFIPKVSI